MLFLLIQEQSIGSGKLPPGIHSNHKEVEFLQFQIRPGLTPPSVHGGPGSSQVDVILKEFP